MFVEDDTVQFILVHHRWACIFLQNIESGKESYCMLAMKSKLKDMVDIQCVYIQSYRAWLDIRVVGTHKGRCILPLLLVFITSGYISLGTNIFFLFLTCIWESLFLNQSSEPDLKQWFLTGVPQRRGHILGTRNTGRPGSQRFQSNMFRF